MPELILQIALKKSRNRIHAKYFGDKMISDIEKFLKKEQEKRKKAKKLSEVLFDINESVSETLDLIEEDVQFD